MSEDRFLEKYRIDSARAWWHDYDGGAYFITICTENREHYFGEIEDGKMVLSEIGEYTSQCIKQITQHNPYAEIPMYVIMPNHLHLIVFIVETVHAPSQNTQNNNPTVDETVHAPSLQSNRWKDNAVDKEMQLISKQKGRLSTAIGGLNSAVTHFANQTPDYFAWQSRFYDRIVRNQPEMNRIATYIENNVANWKDDEFYTPRK
jgi:REP element-mobilizing transposase RayT